MKTKKDTIPAGASNGDGVYSLVLESNSKLLALAELQQESLCLHEIHYVYNQLAIPVCQHFPIAQYRAIYSPRRTGEIFFQWKVFRLSSSELSGKFSSLFAASMKNNIEGRGQECPKHPLFQNSAFYIE